jgi:fibronectin type 3 domain-containing protein
VSWTASSGAVSYNLYWSTSASVSKTTGTKVASATSGAAMTGLSNGTLYYFVVTAVNGGGESAESTPVASATPQLPVPAPPTGVTATAGSSQVTVSWTASSGAVSYNLYWSTSASVSKSIGTKVAGATSGVSVSGLSNGTTYYFVATAVNGGGEGAESTPVASATPQPPAPNAPTSVAAFPGHQRAFVTWTASSTATSNNLYWSTSAGVSKSIGTKVSGATSGAAVTGLSNGTLYYFVVTAVNGGGESAESSPAASTTPVNPGQVIALLGSDSSGNIVASSEVYDGTTDAWTSATNGLPVSAGGLIGAAATVLGTGKVLVAGGGGQNNGLTTNTASLWDPTSNTWAATASMGFGRVYFGLGTLTDGTALAAGGCSGGCTGNNALGQTWSQVAGSSERFGGASWTTAGNLTTLRSGVSNPLLLADGRVLLCGGNNGVSVTYSSCELFTASGSGGSWASSALTLPDAGSRQMMLVGGKVLVINGTGTTSYLWDPAASGTPSFGSNATLPTTQLGGRMTVLPDGRVMIVGGYLNNGTTNPPLATVQIWVSGTNSWTAAVSLTTARYGPVVASLADGRVLVAGGNAVPTTNAQPLSSVEIWSPVTQQWSSGNSLGTARNTPMGMRVK